MRRSTEPRTVLLRPLSALLLLAGLAACRPVAPPVTVPEGLPTAEPLVRVGIAVDTPEVVIGADGAFTLRHGQETRQYPAGERLTVAADGEQRLVVRDRAGVTAGPFAQPITIATANDSPVLIGTRSYRGTLLLRATNGGRVTAVNVLEMERYLLGVVPGEIPSLPGGVEAVKAQAIAARTYAIGHMGRRNAQGFDFFATVSDQVYGGLALEDTMATRAVRETRGQILTHNGRPILAYYHSTCGGRTADAGAVWRQAPLPYLQPVSDQVPGSDRYYCDISNRFRWSVRWRADDLVAILRTTLQAHAGPTAAAIRSIQRIEIDGRTPGGRVQHLRIATDAGTFSARGDSLRWVLRPEPSRILNSALLFRVDDRGSGAAREILVEGGGWGHGIGMCQWGAIGRARAGQNYERILTSYYRDTRVTSLY
jgi:stage II sporulation protein D